MILEDKKNFVKTAEVKTGDVVKFLDEGNWVESKTFKKPDGTFVSQFQIKVMICELEKTLSLNGMSREAMKKAYGKDTANWIGKEAVINKFPTPQGKEMIVLSPRVVQA